MYYVYWIHLPSHEDIKRQGYVGITYNTKKRWAQHKSNAKNSTATDCIVLLNAIRKYGNELQYEVVLEGTKELCEFVELELRGTPHTGWNIAVGGASTMYKRHHSPETIEKIKAYKITDAQRLKMSLASKGRKKSEEHKAKIGNSHRGRKLSEESKKLISNRKKGTKVEALRKIVIASTGEVFVGVTDAGIWACTNKSSIKKCADGKQYTAGKHPTTGEKLTWKYKLKELS